MTHDELRALTGAYVLGSLDPREREAFEAHLQACAECATEVDGFQPVIERLALSVPRLAPPQGLRDRIMATIRMQDPRSIPRAGGRFVWLAPAAGVLLVLSIVFPLALRACRRCQAHRSRW